MNKLTPNSAVKNIRDSVNYYIKHFGFTLLVAVSEDKSEMGDTLVEGKEYVWANLTCGGVSLMLQRADALKEDVGDFFQNIGSSTSFYIEVDDVDALYAKVKDDVTLLKDIETTWYGQREFYVQDLDGYVLCFATPAKKE